MNFEQFLEREWRDYCDVAPQAKKIHQLFEAKGELICNDHVAIRTLAHPSVGLEAFTEFFTEFGYKACGEYEFIDKRLRAIHLEANNKPLVFISEFLYEDEKFSNTVSETIESLIAACDGQSLNELFTQRKTWQPSHKIYEQLLLESEYAAWFYAWGFRVNHFTVSVNHLKSMTEVDQLNIFLQQNDIELNRSGGEIKGTKEQGLVQSSTMADQFLVNFLDGAYQIPSCYYEFAKRYEVNGEIYTGFVPTSADKIFESTNRK